MSKVGTYDPNAVNGNKSFKKRKYFKIEQDKSNIYRVLPPYGSAGIAVYYQVFWVTGTGGKNRPVQTLLKKSKDRGIIQRCPLFDKVEALKLQLAAISNDPNYDQNIVKAKKDQVDRLRLQGGYYLNAMDQAGDIGLLRVPYTAFQSLKKKLDVLKTEGVDPINPGAQNGVFFDFKRYKDEKGKTIYEVEISQKTRRDENGRMIKEYNWAPIDETVLKRMETEASELGSLYKTLTVEEMTRIATLDPAQIDAVFANPEQSEDDEYDAGDFEEAPAVQTAPTQSATTSPQMAATPARTAPTNTAQTVTTPLANNTAAMKVNQQLSNDDLVNQFLKNS